MAGRRLLDVGACARFVLGFDLFRFCGLGYLCCYLWLV